MLAKMAEICLSMLFIVLSWKQ